ncbi:MAG TPA: glycosyltransferase [Pyrinomonadaceae bacterium]|jgi:glycosyltransferase involved in cell wall biosynthesis
MRILIVSYAFPPFNSIGGVRVGKTAKYLLGAGHDVRVIAAREQPFPRTLPLEIPEERVEYTRWLNIRKPVEVVSKDAPAAKNAEKPVAARKGLGQALKSGVRFALRTFVYFPDANIGWFPYAVRSARRFLKDWRPDIILASSPPPSTLLVARHLAKRYRVPWVADLRDLWVDHQYYDQPRLRETIERRLEQSVLNSAAGLVTVSEPLAETLRTKYGREPVIVMNGFDPSDYPARKEEERASSESSPFRILYTGVVYEGRQDPSPLFAALKELGAEMKAVEVAFYGSFLQKVRELVAVYGVEAVVQVNDPVPYRQSLQMQTEADVLLLLLWNDPEHKGVYTGKLFEYIGARRPILAVGNPGDVAAELIQSRGLGVVSNDVNQILDHLRGWIKRKRETGRITFSGEREVTEFSREEQTRVLEQYLSRLIK